MQGWVVAGAWLLDLDHVGTEIAENHRAERPGEVAGEIEHPEIGQRCRHGVRVVHHACLVVGSGGRHVEVVCRLRAVARVRSLGSA